MSSLSSSWRLSLSREARAYSAAIRSRIVSLSLSRLSEPRLFGEFVVEGERVARGDGLHRRLEVGGLPRQRAHGVSLREGRANRALVADGDADKLILEPRQERVRAQRNLDVPPFAALEGNAVDRSVEIDRDAVMNLGRRARGLLAVGAALLRETIERGLDIGRLDVGGQDARARFARNRQSRTPAALRARP